MRREMENFSPPSPPLSRFPFHHSVRIKRGRKKEKKKKERKAAEFTDELGRGTNVPVIFRPCRNCSAKLSFSHIIIKAKI